MMAGIAGRVFARLDARLTHDGPEPVALALSGGGDSRALLALAAAWGRQRGRRILALTVDHRLNPASADWTRRAGEQAKAEGVEWQALVWDEPRAGSGLQNRARQARHALLADAARAAGAAVILTGHTADDDAENRLMQAQGTSLGQLREWAPSPVWPQGRGLVLMRPLLGERREALRDYLRVSERDWIDDPANDNPAFHRVRVRQELAGKPPSEGIVDGPSRVDLQWEPAPLCDFGALPFRRDALVAAGGRVLAMALLCAGGTVVPPRGDRLEGLMARLAGDADFTAVLCGARIEVCGDEVTIVREAGEMRRSRLAPLSLPAGREVVWDGRFAICAAREGYRVEAAHGWLSKLERADRAILATLPPAVRAVQPVLLSDGSQSPLLALGKVKLQALVAGRFRLNACLEVGETTQEAGLFAALHGVTGPTALFSV